MQEVPDRKRGKKRKAGKEKTSAYMYLFVVILVVFECYIETQPKLAVLVFTDLNWTIKLTFGLG